MKERTGRAAPSAATARSGTATVDGLEMYYEDRGVGDALVVIPGGLMTAAMMEPLAVPLARGRRVVTIEPQAHGHTPDADRPLTYERLADDAASLIGRLGLGRADVLGFSMGGEIALQTAIRHPRAVRKLVVVSGGFRSDGEYPEIRDLEQAFAPDLPMLAPFRRAHVAASSSPERWASLVAKTRRLLGEEYDWSAQVAAVVAPTLVVIGDADTLPVSHAVELFARLGGETAEGAMGAPCKARLAVLPGTSHLAIVQHPDLPGMISNFLEAPMAEAR